MRNVVRELLTAFMTLTLAYLVLIHFTGFSKDVGAIGAFTANTWKVAQGR